MISSIPRKNISLILASLLIAVALLTHGASTAFASTARSTIPHTNSTHMAPAIPGWHRHWRRIPFGKQKNNQVFQGCVRGTDNKSYHGFDQGNSGNSGVNLGVNEDDSSNATNQIVNKGVPGHKINNQLFQICARDSENLHFTGVRQGNSGNSGFNAGVNEDDSTNVGNQIIIK